MLLSENQAVVDALKKILEDYAYLEYDEESSRNQDFLRVKVTDPKTNRDISVARRISRELGISTGIDFLNPSSAGSGPRNPNTDWTYFNIREYKKIAVNPDTGQYFMISVPALEVVRQAILELEYPVDGLRVVNATERLAEKLQISDENKRAKNRSDLNFFRYDVVAPQFKRLLQEGKLAQPNGPRTPYFPADMDSDPSNLELRDPTSQFEWPSVERMALNSDTGEEYQIQLPATPIVKQALLDFDYPPSGIRITDIAEALADQFELTEKQRKSKGKYGLVWKRHVNIAANSLVNSGQLLRIKRGWIINPEQPDIESSESDDSPFAHGDTASPEVVIEQNYEKHQDRLKEELLQKIMDNSSDFFEELIPDVLIKMGYGRSHEDVELTGGSGDGGIDGIIYQDPLRLDAIYFQAKRWDKGNIHRPEIDKFIGALILKGASKGVFITTSRFSEGAKVAANEAAGPKIILIDGKKLVQLMIDHDVGVSFGDSYQLKEVDLDYFVMGDSEA